MTSVAARLPSSTDVPLLASIGALLLTAGVVGASLALNTPIGLALLLGLVYLALAMSNLQLGLAVWFPLVFLEGLTAFNLGAKAAGLLIIGVWFATLGKRRERVLYVLRVTPWFWATITALLIWCSLSLLWATDTGMVLADLWHWYAVAVLALIVATTVTDRRVLGWMLLAFVVGATLGVAQGIVTGGLTSSATAIDTASEGRLEGGTGDPNFLAAGIASAIIIVLGMFTALRGRATRWWLMVPLGILALGLAASESRGGAVAAAVAVVAAVVAFRNRRAEVVAVVAIAVGIGMAWFSISPSAWDRVSDFDSGGSGRDELWQVAWRMSADNPIVGVGLNNYPVVANDYVSEPGSLERLDLIVDKAQVAHNAYLQLLAETGVIGLGLFLVVAGLSLSAAWRAAGRFRRAGDRRFETVMHGLVVAMIALLAASFFISNGVDKRLWVLFGLGPASLAVATRTLEDSQSGSERDDSEESSEPDESAVIGGDIIPLDRDEEPEAVSGDGRGLASLQPTMTSSSSRPGQENERFLDVAAIEMQRLQDTATRANERLRRAIPEGEGSGELTGTVEMLVRKNDEIAAECARVSEIIRRISSGDPADG